MPALQRCDLWGHTWPLCCHKWSPSRTMSASSAGDAAFAARIARFSRHCVSIATSAALGSASAATVLDSSCCAHQQPHIISTLTLYGVLQRIADTCLFKLRCVGAFYSNPVPATLRATQNDPTGNHLSLSIASTHDPARSHNEPDPEGAHQTIAISSQTSRRTQELCCPAQQWENTCGAAPPRRALRPKLPEDGPDLPPACPAGPWGAPGVGRTRSGRPASMWSREDSGVPGAAAAAAAAAAVSENARSPHVRARSSAGPHSCPSVATLSHP